MFYACKAVRVAAFVIACCSFMAGVLACGSVRAGRQIASLEVVDFDHLMVGCTTRAVAERILWKPADSTAGHALSISKTMAVELAGDNGSKSERVYWIAYGLSPDAPWFFPGQPMHSGRSSGGATSYTAPCPSTPDDWFRWSVFALDTVPGLKAGFSAADFEAAVEGHILAEGSLRTHYQIAP